MGWASGSELFERIAKTISGYVGDPEKRHKIYRQMYEDFRDFDCDTLYECKGIDPELDKIIDEDYEE